jgi:UDP:flavonoid glycosyltransferase YjiC (YdhE family)
MTALDVLFISGDIGGNVPPTLAIAGELARRGHRVTVAGLRARPGEQIPDGIAEVPIPALADMDVSRNPGRLGHGPTLLRMAAGAAVSRDVHALLGKQRPNVIVVDGVMLRSLREALASGIPTAVLFHSLGKLWNDGMNNGLANALMRPFGLAPRALMDRAHALLLPTDRDLDPAGRGPIRFPFQWLGTTERARPPEPRAPAAPSLVLVTLGSVWQRKEADVYRRIIAALGQLDGGESPVRAIVTTGGVQFDGELSSLPNVEIIRGRAPHAEILPRADLVIGHGGHSTTLRALAHGVPLLILPMDPTSDQPMTAKAVEAAGVGRRLSRRAKPEAIRDAVREILSDRDIVAEAARTGERLRGQRGAEAGADRIEAIARTG